MKSNPIHTMTAIGLSLIILSGIMLFFALSQPRVYDGAEEVATVSTTAETANTTATQTDEENISEAVTQKESGMSAEIAYPLNINTTTAEELMTIEGIGEKKALAIIEYREYLGGYTDVKQIMEIKGFGEGVYNQIAPYLTV